MILDMRKSIFCSIFLNRLLTYVVSYPILVKVAHFSWLSGKDLWGYVCWCKVSRLSMDNYYCKICYG